MNTEQQPLLIIGATGQVGGELLRTLAPLGPLAGAALDADRESQRIDLATPGSVTEVLERVRPRLLINAAAYTAVDKAESERDIAQRVNADALAEMGIWAAANAVPVIHYSTDFVFDGTAQRPYREGDPAAPLSVYGATKLAGERALADSGAPYLIFRTSWVYGNRGANFMLTILRLFREREQLSVVDDQIGAPTWSRMIAEVTAQVVGGLLRGDMDIQRVQGLYHLTAAGSTSWHGFARAILQHSGLNCELLAIPTKDYPTPAVRPAYSVLDNSLLRDTFGLALPDWQESLVRCMEESVGLNSGT